MSRLDYLGASNVHGRIPKIEIPDLQPVACILAPNDAGKTTTLDLVRLLVSPKPSEPYFDHAGFEVVGEWSDGLKVRRATGSDAKQHVEIDGKPTAVKAAAAEVARRLGGAVAFSMDGWLKLTAADRVRYFDELVPDEAGEIGDDYDWMLAELNGYRTAPALGMDPWPSLPRTSHRKALRFLVDGIAAPLKLVGERVADAKRRAAQTPPVSGLVHLPTLVAREKDLTNRIHAMQRDIDARAAAAALAQSTLALLINAPANRDARAALEAAVDAAEGNGANWDLVTAWQDELASVRGQILGAERDDALGKAIATACAELGGLLLLQQSLSALHRNAGQAFASVVAADLRPVFSCATAITQAVAGFSMGFKDDGAEIRLTVRDDLTRSDPIEFSDLNRSRLAIAGVAFHVATVQFRTGWRVVLLDRLEEIEQTRRSTFLEHLLGLHSAGMIDNVLTACVTDGWTPPDGVQIVALEAP